jgi:SAM-dependent methyltransferase
MLDTNIAGERELGSDVYHNNKYKRKLGHRLKQGDISREEMKDCWEKHGRKTGSRNEETAEETESVKDVSLLSSDRGQRKAWQIENFVYLLQDRLMKHQQFSNAEKSQNKASKLTVVDFGCGSGNLCLALAPYFSNVQFILVDKKQYPLKLAERRALEAGLRNVQVVEYKFSPSNLDEFQYPVIQSPLPNSAPLDGKNVSSNETSTSFDIAIGLHCCGSFTDMVMTLAKDRGADCIVCPCCNGAMTSKTTCGYEYPRSQYIRKIMNQDEYLGQLTRAADDRENYEAKCLIEYDRALWATENGFDVSLFKLTPKLCTPKHHVLYLVNRDKQSV